MMFLGDLYFENQKLLWRKERIPSSRKFIYLTYIIIHVNFKKSIGHNIPIFSKNFY